MDEEQLVGAVTHMIGDKQVLIYMEQALTKVVKAKQNLAALEARAKVVETEVKQASAEVLRLDQMKVSKLADIDREVNAYRVNEKGKVDKDIMELRAVKEQELHDMVEAKTLLESQLVSLGQAADVARNTLTSLEAQVATAQYEMISATQAKERAEAELARVTKLVREIKQKFE